MIAANPIVLARFNVKGSDWLRDRVGIVDRKNKRILDVTGLDSQGQKIESLEQIFGWTDRVTRLRKIWEANPTDQKPPVAKAAKEKLSGGPSNESRPKETRVFNISQVEFESPIPDGEVWGAGVTYDRSRLGRNDEVKSSSKGGFLNKLLETVYDAIYKAKRPEIFFKSQGRNVVPHGGTVGIRADEKGESVPEAELGLVFSPINDKTSTNPTKACKQHLVGFTVGNDMSARDIEGANPLNLPQAKIYKGSCAIGSFVVLADENINEATVRDWKVRLKVIRDGQPIDFKAMGIEPKTLVGNITRSFTELYNYLTKCNTFDKTVTLLTGTGIVPPKGKFSLKDGDRVEITIENIGTLINTVKVVPERLSLAESKAMSESRMPDVSSKALAA